VSLPTAKQQFEQLLIALREGYIDPNVFFAQSNQVWQRLAKYLMRKWRAPAWYTHEDVEQELRLAAYDFIWRYQEEKAKGRAIDRYVEWNALDKSKKALHVARGAKLSGDPDKNPSRIETPFSMYEVAPESEPGDVVRQDELYERQEIVAELEKRFTTERERLAVRVLAANAGSIEDAALELSNHPEFTGGLDASRFVVGVAERLLNA
jgi:hypothetical protein